MSSRSKLIEVAITLFSEKGYEGTSVRDISEKADANISLISYYFGGKSGLLAAILKTMANERFSEATRFFSKCDTKAEFQIRLESFMHELASLFAEQAPLTKVFLQALEHDYKKELNTTYFEMIDALRSFIVTAQKKDLSQSPETPSLF